MESNVRPVADAYFITNGERTYFVHPYFGDDINLGWSYLGIRYYFKPGYTGAAYFPKDMAAGFIAQAGETFVEFENLQMVEINHILGKNNNTQA